MDVYFLHFAVSKRLFSVYRNMFEQNEMDMNDY